MTFEELLECDAPKLEKITTEELLAWFGPRLKISRPELARQERKSSSSSKGQQLSFLSPEEQAKKNKVKDILAELGMSSLEIDEMDV